MKIELSGHFDNRRIIRSVTPSILMMLVVSVYSIVDGLFVSNFAGTTAFAAVNLVMPILMITGSLGVMIGTGGSALISKTMGEGDVDNANRIFSMLIQFALFASVLLTILIYFFLPSIVRWMGSDEAMFQPCVTYGRLCLLAMPAFVLQMAFHSLFMTAEKPQIGTTLSIVCGVVNIIGDAIFVGLFRWGVIGAAIATGIAQIVGGFFPIYYFLSHNNTSSLKLVYSRLEWKHIGKACLNGVSEYVGNIAFSVVCMGYNFQLMRHVGQMGVSAYGVIMYVGMIFCSCFIGYNIGITPIIGYHYGAKNHNEMHNLLVRSFLLTFLLGLLILVVCEITASFTTRIFVGYDAELFSFTTKAYRIYVFSFLLCGVNMFVSALFTSLNNGLISAVAAICRSLVFELGCVFVIPMIFGIDGIWMAVNVAEFLTCILCVGLVLTFRKRYGY